MTLVLLGFPEEKISEKTDAHRAFYSCRPHPNHVAGYCAYGKSKFMLRIWYAPLRAQPPVAFILGWTRSAALVEVKCDSALHVQAHIFDFVQKLEPAETTAQPSSDYFGAPQ